MKRAWDGYVILTGGLFLLLGFLLPWYSPSAVPGQFAVPGYALSTPPAPTISGLQLCLGGRFMLLAFVPGLVSAFSVFLWIFPVGALLTCALAILECCSQKISGRWLRRATYAVLLLLIGMVLWPVVVTNLAIQFGLGLCVAGWLLILLSVGLDLPSSTASSEGALSSARRTRRGVLRGFVGLVGGASLGLSGFLVWSSWRTHASRVIYRYRTPIPGRALNGNGPDLDSPGLNAILSVDWSPDGQRILVAQLQAPPQSWDAFTGEQRQTYQPADATAGAWSPDGRQLVFSNHISFWATAPTVVDATTGEIVAVFDDRSGSPGRVEEAVWSPDSQYLAVGDTFFPRISLWKPATGRRDKTLTIPFQNPNGTFGIQDLAWSPTGEYLAATIPEADTLLNGTGVEESSFLPAGLAGVYVWQIQSGDLLFHYQAEIPSNPFGGTVLSWSPDGKRLAFANRTTVQLLDLILRRPVLTYTGHVLIPTAVAWSPNGKYLASSSADWTVQVWEAASGALRFLYQGHTAIVRDVAWSPDGRSLVSCSDDGTARVWQPEF